ncbi:hypothetical protein V6Z12_D01G149900 [Gossypium hirsutum]
MAVYQRKRRFANQTSCETFWIQTYFWTLCLLHSVLS